VQATIGINLPLLSNVSKVAYAKALADRIGVAQHDIPAAALASKVGASAFIDSLNDQIPPTTKQLDFVTKLCQRHNMNPATVGDRTRSFKVMNFNLLCFFCVKFLMY